MTNDVRPCRHRSRIGASQGLERLGALRIGPFRHALGALAAIGIVALAADASAFCRSSTCRATAKKECALEEGCPADGAKLFWPTSCISYATNARGTIFLDPAETREVIRKTFQEWSDVTCADGSTASMTFQERDPVACKKSEYNKERANVNVVMFQDTDWRYRGIDATLAKTSVTFNDQTGEILDADIEINTAFNKFTISDDPAEVQTDLQAVVTHEVGHFIGLAHSMDMEAVMFASYAPGSTVQRHLSPDDIDAICTVYPANNGRACNTEPRNGFSGSCDEVDTSGTCAVAPGAAPANASGVSYGAIAVIGGVGFAVARRRKRRRAPSGATNVTNATCATDARHRAPRANEPAFPGPAPRGEEQ